MRSFPDTDIDQVDPIFSRGQDKKTGKLAYTQPLTDKEKFIPDHELGFFDCQALHL